jgi:diadenylate cyclase
MWAWLSNLIWYLEPYLLFPDIIRHLFDIAIVAYLLYRLLLLIRETRAEQVLKGLAILLFATWLSGVMRFNAIHMILRNTAELGVIALLIVFQPELRRALEKIGRGSVIDKAMFMQIERDKKAMFEEIVKAVQKLAKSKLGALIVIERKTGLNDVIETGVKIDAKVTEELLENIFIPNTPLHDGAVIIRDDRIAAAGCFLPLTENPNTGKQLGTRHRAALGISELSDSLSLVVSEETSVISLAVDGKLIRHLEPKTLMDMLEKLHNGEKETRSFNLMRWRSKNG